MRKILVLLVFITILSGGVYFYFRFIKLKSPLPYSPLPNPEIAVTDIYQGISYEPIEKNKYQVTLFADKLLSPTRVKITPDGKHLLVSQVGGEVLAFDRKGTEWDNSPYLVTKVATNFPGFPPDEAGLTGFIFSSQFTKNGKLFLLYTFKDKTGTTLNRISVSKISERNGRLFGTTPRLVYQANIAGSGSHQITDGVGLMVGGKPHLLFLIGEGFDGKRAQNLEEEGGKVILIQEDGSKPLGVRPFAENPKIEALGIRNAFVITKNMNDPKNRYLFADTGPDKYDRLIYTQFGGENLKAINFGWDGNQDNLTLPVPDPNNSEVADTVLYRFPETRTVTGLAFFQNSDKFLMTLFGKTGSSQNSPGKEIWLGELTELDKQPKVSFRPIIKRVPEADGKLGNPIGLEFDQKTNSFFFLDIMEGRLYQVEEGGDNDE